MLSFDAPYHVVKVWGLLKESIFRQFFFEKIILQGIEYNIDIPVLMNLLLLYDITPQEKATLHIEKLAYDVIHNVWKYEKKNLLDPKLQQNDDQMYSMMFVWSVLHSVVECWRFAKSWLEMFQQYAQCTTYFFQKYISKNSRPVGRDFLPKITGRRISRPRA